MLPNIQVAGKGIKQRLFETTGLLKGRASRMNVIHNYY
jgi:hypothetical protein